MKLRYAYKVQGWREIVYYDCVWQEIWTDEIIAVVCHSFKSGRWQFYKTFDDWVAGKASAKFDTDLSTGIVRPV